MDYDDFVTYKDIWLHWRALGHASETGAFIPPVSFVEASQLPKRMLDTFFALDYLIGVMKRQLTKGKTAPPLKTSTRKK